MSNQRIYVRRERLDPAAELRLLRAEGPLTKVPVESEGGSIWVATGYEEVRRILADHVRFSTRRRFGSTGRHRPRELIGHLMDYDPPEHTRLRRMLTPEFTARRMQRLEPRVESIVAGCLDDMERAGPPVDLVKMFGAPIPMAVLCELIGVPRDDRADFERRSRLQLDPGGDARKRAAAGATQVRYLGALVARARKDPDDGFIGMLVREHGANVTDEELRGVCGLLILAGLDNISGMIGLGTLALLERHDRGAALRTALLADPDRAVEELLRHLSVAHFPTPRVALVDVAIGDQLIKAGELVICSIPTANRDPALTGEPDRLDLAREPGGHVAFGHGVHRCIGAALSRLQLRIAYLALFARFPGLRLALPAGAVPFRVDTPTYGVARLPVTW